MLPKLDDSDVPSYFLTRSQILNVSLFSEKAKSQSVCFCCISAQVNLQLDYFLVGQCSQISESFCVVQLEIDLSTDTAEANTLILLSNCTSLHSVFRIWQENKKEHQNDLALEAWTLNLRVLLSVFTSASPVWHRISPQTTSAPPVCSVVTFQFDLLSN